MSATQRMLKVGPTSWQEPDIREKAAEAVIATRDTIAQVVDKAWAGDPHTSYFEDWNLRDLICHINAWVELCQRRLHTIEAGANTLSAIDVAAFNRAVHQSHRRIPLSVAVSDNAQVLNDLAAAAHAIPDPLPARSELPNESHLRLCRYVLIDGFAHPTQHLMFHCLKRRHMQLYFALEQQTRSRFRWFVPNNRNAALCFRDYFPCNADCALFFENLRPDIRNEAQRDVWDRTLLASLREGSA
jgi:hypothetical protein